MKLIMNQFRIRNFRNIEDSNWIPFEQVTALVGRNESGKTAVLQALYKFNPSDEDPYIPQREFPRDRFAREFHENGEEFPVCEIQFILDPDFRKELESVFGKNEPPKKVTCTRYYDGSLDVESDSKVNDDLIPSSELLEAIAEFEKSVRRIKSTQPEQEESIQNSRTAFLDWTSKKQNELQEYTELRNEKGKEVLTRYISELNSLSKPDFADLIEALIGKINQLIERSKLELLSTSLHNAIEQALPIFIYFENYGILDSAVYLPRLLEQMRSDPNDPKVRTVNAMFKHVGLTAEDINSLGAERTAQARQQQKPITDAMVLQDQASKELREIKLNSASISITEQFNKWYGQRRHNIRYQADGDYFRIWVSDDKRPGIEIELESRSKGFQWFFSFYLVFLVESQEGHKDAILLLDEPGLHLHPTAQQELISFFERLSKDNPLIYTTHSPFLIDGEHLHRVRPVKEDDKGHSQISIDTWPEDRDTIFPLQAAAGYAMVRGLFQHKKNVLVEGFSDYLYLHSLNLHCHATSRVGLPEDIYITPCGGTKNVGYIASLFLGQEVRPIILLDSDAAGRDRHNSLLKELYAGHEKALLLLSEILDIEECEMEDILGGKILLPEINNFLGKTITFNDEDRKSGSLIDQVKASAKRHKIDLPEGWKAEIARRLVVKWSTINPSDIPTNVLDLAEKLFKVLNEKFSGKQLKP